MLLDYDGRLRARRVAGAVAPLVLLPLAGWVWVSTPVASAEPAPAARPGESDEAAPAGPVSVVVTGTAAPDGSFEVVEELTFAAPTDSVVLRLPAITPAGEQFAGVVPQVVDLAVGTGGDAVPASVSTGYARVRLPVPSTSVRLTYTWWGTAVPTRPSPPGRALAALAPLSEVEGAAVRFRVDGSGERNLSCPLSGDGGLACAVAADGGLATQDLDAATAVVLVQLDVA